MLWSAFILCQTSGWHTALHSMESTRTIVVYLYPGMTALDAIGPYEILRGLPGAVVQFVARQRGPVTVDSTFLRLQADLSCDESHGRTSSWFRAEMHRHKCATRTPWRGCAACIPPHAGR
jgi:putative intracellular protease/amidase